MSRKVDYFIQDEISTDGTFNAICQIPSRWVPVAISALEGRKGRSFWIDPEAYEYAYSLLSRFQAELLMDAKEELIIEIRGVRGPVPPATEFDLETYPVGSFPGFTLGTIDTRLHSDGTTIAQKMQLANQKLDQVIAALQAQAGTDASMLENLVQIAALLAV